jgi:hypothetical protein
MEVEMSDGSGNNSGINDYDDDVMMMMKEEEKERKKKL